MGRGDVVWEPLQNLRFALVHQHEGPPISAEVERCVVLIENQYLPNSRFRRDNGAVLHDSAESETYVKCCLGERGAD